MMAAAAYRRLRPHGGRARRDGPGGLNLASGAGVAFNNHLAVLLITDQPASRRELSAQRHVHGPGHARRVRAADQVERGRARPAPHAGAGAPRVSRSARRRPGPVHLDIPQDVLATECEFADDEFDLSPRRYRAPSRVRARRRRAIAAAAELLRQARRPLIVAGGGVVASGAEQRVRELGATPGRAGRADADGARRGRQRQSALHRPWRPDRRRRRARGLRASRRDPAASAAATPRGCGTSAARSRAAHHRHVNINIDPAALGAPALHEVALQADAGLALADLLAALGNAGDLRRRRRLAAVAAEPARAIRAQARRDGEGAVAGDASGGAGARHRRALPRDALAVYDGGHTTFWSNDLTPVHDVRTRFHDPGMSHLGFGLPYALALQLTHPGGRWSTSPATARSASRCRSSTPRGATGCPSSRSSTTTRPGASSAPGSARSSTSSSARASPSTDYAAIARGFGCHGETVTQADEVAPALRARACLRIAGGDRLPHAFRPPPVPARVRQHEPLRLRCIDPTRQFGHAVAG